MNETPRADRPIGGLFAGIDAATQVAAEAFAARYGATVTATLTVPGRKRPSRWPATEPTPSVTQAIEDYATVMAEAYGVDPSEFEATIRFEKTGKEDGSKSFYQAVVRPVDPASDLPIVTFSAARNPEAETFVGRAALPLAKL